MNKNETVREKENANEESERVRTYKCPNSKDSKKENLKLRNTSDAAEREQEKKSKRVFLLRVRIEFVLIMKRLRSVQMHFFALIQTIKCSQISIEQCNGYLSNLLSFHHQRSDA